LTSCPTQFEPGFGDAA